MAVYYFELKSDQRKNGKQTSALQHVKYINREGIYKNADERELSKLAAENIISGPKRKEHAPGRELLLYSSPFGIIKQDDSGIHVSRNASLQTTAIALEVAKHLYGNNLQIQGQELFQRQVLAAASQLRLDIHFQSELYQSALSMQERNDEHERRAFESTGGVYKIPNIHAGRFASSYGFPEFFADGTSVSKNSATIFKSDIKRPSISEFAQRGWRLPALSGRNLVLPKQQPDMLLHDNAGRQLQRCVRRRQNALPQLRWDVSGTRKDAIEETVNKILYNLQHHLDKTFASSHVQYINRESVFEQRGGCIYKAHHLPAWAKDNPLKFFAAADRYERSNGERYKEIIFSLPNELNLSQQKEIIDRFLAAHMKDFYYAYAIHDKIGTMSNGEHHTHVHLMFSTRLIDEAERRQERKPAVFFSRVNTTVPEKGGCRKSSAWNGKDRIKNLTILREDFAKIQNETLAKYSVPLRVDHRSLKARRQEALAKGNTFLADLLNRVPERAVGPLALLEKGNPKVLAQQRLRAMNQLREKNLVAKTFLLDGMQQNKLQKRMNEMQNTIDKLSHLLNEEEKHALSDTLQEMNQKQELLHSIWAAALWSAEAIESSMLAFMKEEERETWQSFKAAGQELKNWQQFKDSLQADAFESPAQWQDVQLAVEREISKIRQTMQQTAPHIQTIYARLGTPRQKQEILRHAGFLLSDSRQTKTKLASLLQQQEKTLETLRERYERLQNSLRQSPAYTAGTVSDYLAESLKELYTKEHLLRAELREAAKKVISPARAFSMAQNVYTKGEFKKLRAAEREWRKAEQSKKMTPEEQAAQAQKLQEWRSRLEAACAKPEAQSKIHEICAGILRKNLPHLIPYQKTQQAHQSITAAIQELKIQAEAARHQSYKDRDQVLYKTIGSSSSAGYASPPRMIAAAIAGNSDCAVLVAKSRKDMPDDWTLLSESDREDLKNNTAKMM